MMTNNMPSDRCENKKTVCRLFWGKMRKNLQDYAKNSPDYARISKVGEMDNNRRVVKRKHFKVNFEVILYITIFVFESPGTCFKSLICVQQSLEGTPIVLFSPNFKEKLFTSVQ